MRRARPARPAAPLPPSCQRRSGHKLAVFLVCRYLYVEPLGVPRHPVFCLCASGWLGSPSRRARRRARRWTTWTSGRTTRRTRSTRSRAATPSWSRTRRCGSSTTTCSSHAGCTCPRSACGRRSCRARRAPARPRCHGRLPSCSRVTRDACAACRAALRRAGKQAAASWSPPPAWVPWQGAAQPRWRRLSSSTEPRARPAIQKSVARACS